jgi:hypothetical protein
MTRYISDDIHFAYPNGWIDRSMIAFAAPSVPDAAVAPNVLVVKDLATEGSSPERYVDKQLVEAAQRFEGFILIDRLQLAVDGHPAAGLNFAWISGGLKLRQQQIFVVVMPVLYLIIFTSLADHAAAHAETFALIRDSIRIGLGRPPR